MLQFGCSFISYVHWLCCGIISCHASDSHSFMKERVICDFFKPYIYAILFPCMLYVGIEYL